MKKIIDVMIKSDTLKGRTVYHIELGRGKILSETTRGKDVIYGCVFSNHPMEFISHNQLISGTGIITLERTTDRMDGDSGDPLTEVLKTILGGK